MEESQFQRDEFDEIWLNSKAFCDHGGTVCATFRLVLQKPLSSQLLKMFLAPGSLCVRLTVAQWLLLWPSRSEGNKLFSDSNIIYSRLLMSIADVSLRRPRYKKYGLLVSIIYVLTGRCHRSSICQNVDSVTGRSVSTPPLAPGHSPTTTDY